MTKKLTKSKIKVRKKSNEELSKLIERDLTALAREKRLPSAHGVDASFAEVIAILEQNRKAPLLAGEPGVGKSAVVQEIARRIAAGMVSEKFAKARILEVPLAGVFARTSNPKQAAELFEQLLEELAEVADTLVYVRDAALFEGSSLVPVLIRALRAGRLRFLFEAELRHAQQLLRSDEALGERVHLLMVNEPSLERARWILGRVAEELEHEQPLAIDPHACDMALRLATRFLLARRLPRKALELLRRSSAGPSALPAFEALVEVFNGFYFGGDPEGDPADWQGFIGDEPLLVDAQHGRVEARRRRFRILRIVCERARDGHGGQQQGQQKDPRTHDHRSLLVVDLVCVVLQSRPPSSSRLAASEPRGARARGHPRGHRCRAATDPPPDLPSSDRSRVRPKR